MIQDYATWFAWVHQAAPKLVRFCVPMHLALDSTATSPTSHKRVMEPILCNSRLICVDKSTFSCLSRILMLRPRFGEAMRERPPNRPSNHKAMLLNFNVRLC